MLDHACTLADRLHDCGTRFSQHDGVGHDIDEPGLPREQAWRSPGSVHRRLATEANVLASRWTDDRTSFRREQAEAPPDCFVVAVALRPTRLRLVRGTLAVFEGTMPAGMVHLTSRAQSLQADFYSPCDFVHFYVAADYLRNLRATAGTDPSRPAPDPSDLLVHDPLAAQLARTITGGSAGDRLYAESVGQTLVIRLLARRAPAPRAGVLPKWRLRRVQDHVQACIDEPITLADLATVAGLSRMHFAAQFRAATGCRPHEYVLQQRIECAKAAMSSTRMKLAEIALSAGFQTQSHFSTVFKRLTGETPARWQRTQAPQQIGLPGTRRTAVPSDIPTSITQSCWISARNSAAPGARPP